MAGSNYDNKAKLLLVLVGLLLLRNDAASALRCFVGRGNSSAILNMKSMEHEEDPSKIPETTATGHHEEEEIFKLHTCGEVGADLPGLDRITKNVTDQIQSGVVGLIRKASDALENGKRRKREDGDSYACLKIVLGNEAFRSCVPKFTSMRMNCTSATTAKLALCYCHEDQCNVATGKMAAGQLVIATLLLTMFTFLH